MTLQAIIENLNPTIPGRGLWIYSDETQELHLQWINKRFHCNLINKMDQSMLWKIQWHRVTTEGRFEPAFSFGRSIELKQSWDEKHSLKIITDALKSLPLECYFQTGHKANTPVQSPITKQYAQQLLDLSQEYTTAQKELEQLRQQERLKQEQVEQQRSLVLFQSIQTLHSLIPDKTQLSLRFSVRKYASYVDISFQKNGSTPSGTYELPVDNIAKALKSNPFAPIDGIEPDLLLYEALEATLSSVRFSEGADWLIMQAGSSVDWLKWKQKAEIGHKQWAAGYQKWETFQLLHRNPIEELIIRKPNRM